MWWLVRADFGHGIMIAGGADPVLRQYNFLSLVLVRRKSRRKKVATQKLPA